MRELFIEWITAAEQTPYKIMNMGGPDVYFDTLINAPDACLTPRRAAMCAWMRENRSECLKILAGIAGLC